MTTCGRSSSKKAVRILAEPRQARRSGPAVLNELGEHPDSKEPVRVLRGRFGPYASDGTVNATIRTAAIRSPSR